MNICISFRPAPQSALRLPLQLNADTPSWRAGITAAEWHPNLVESPHPLHPSPPLDLFTQSQLLYDIGSTEILLPSPVRFHRHALLTDWHMGPAEQKCSL